MHSSTGGFNICRIHLKQFWLVEREKRKKKVWVGNSFKTIVVTAAKGIAPCYCSQCCHMAECLWTLQVKGRIIKYYFLLSNKLIFIASGKYDPKQHFKSQCTCMNTSLWAIKRHFLENLTVLTCTVQVNGFLPILFFP